MSEDATPVRPTAARRGLPRPGDAAPPTAAPTLPMSTPATPASPARRAGLPRGSVATQVSTAESAVAPAADTSPAAPTADANTSKSALAPTPPPPAAGTPRSPAPPEPDRATSPRRRLMMWLLGCLVLLGLSILGARWLVSLPAGQEFLARYPGETHLPAGAPEGLPAWLGWQHFLNAFFLVLIIRTGWQVRTQTRPPASWTRHNTGILRTKNPPKKISLTLWAHLTLDALWLLNGAVFIVVLFASGQWMRVVPTSWEVFPNAVSAALQYLSLNWPTENGWVNYNSLQLLAYFLTIFVAAPLAAATGLRMSAAWPVQAARLNKVYPVTLARAIHFPVMLYFVLFVIMHVTLVLATGAQRNLNHMYAAQDSGSWAGVWIFAGSVLLMVGAVFAARPLFLAPLAQLTGKVGR